MSDLNKDAVALITSALAASREGMTSAALGRYQGDAAAVLRGLESSQDAVKLILILAVDAAGALQIAADHIDNQSAESILRILALRHSLEHEE